MSGYLLIVWQRGQSDGGCHGYSRGARFFPVPECSNSRLILVLPTGPNWGERGGASLNFAVRPALLTEVPARSGSFLVSNWRSLIFKAAAERSDTWASVGCAVKARQAEESQVPLLSHLNSSLPVSSCALRAVRGFHFTISQGLNNLRCY